MNLRYVLSFCVCLSIAPVVLADDFGTPLNVSNSGALSAKLFVDGNRPYGDSILWAKRVQRDLPIRLDGGDPSQGRWVAALGKHGDDFSVINGHELSFRLNKRFTVRAAYGNYEVQQGVRDREHFDAWELSIKVRF